MSTIKRPAKTDADYPTQQDFNLPDTERASILSELQKYIQKAGKSIPSFIWASAQVVSPKDLRRLLNFGRSGDVNQIFDSFAQFQHKDAVFKAWTYWRAPANSASTSGATSPGAQPTSATKLAKQRDQRCIATCSSVEEAAHIVPACFLGDSETVNSRRDLFFKYIEYLWSGDAAVWKVEIEKLQSYSNDASLQSSNLICLNRNVYASWNAGYVALKPLDPQPGENDRKTLRIQFFWQAEMEESDNVPLTRFPSSTEGRTKFINKHRRWVRMDTEEEFMLQSGDILTLQTTDPETHLLPSRTLLMLRWNLTRVLALRAGAEESEESEDNDDDSDDSWLQSVNIHLHGWVSSST